MSETVNQEETKTAEEQPERTFTQTELNAIIKDRLERDRAKYADYEDLKAKADKYDEAEEANKTELQKATERADKLQAQLDTMTKEKQVSEIRTKIAKENNVPVELLTGTDEESCKAQVEVIKKYMPGNNYPDVHDGGETHPISGKGSTKEQFVDWFNGNMK